MLEPSWQVESARGVCAATGRSLREGEEFFTVLFEEGESFRRQDYSAEAWTGPPPGAFCIFRSKMPVREKKRRLLADNDVVVGFFLRLADETDPVRRQFRFVLALLLMRKRLLHYQGSRRDQGVEVWQMVMPRDGTVHDVIQPQMTDAEIDAVSAQLSVILHHEFPTPEEPVTPRDHPEGGSA